MATTVGTETDLESVLVGLIQLDYDAADAYQAAIDGLGDGSWRATLAEFKQDHLRHTTELSLSALEGGEGFTAQRCSGLPEQHL